MAIKFKDRYSEQKIKEEFYTTPDKTEMTDQSQYASASIVEMAKKFGIDAIIAKAEQTQVNDAVKDQLYGHDFTNMFHSAEERLNVRNKLRNVFENVPARIRKSVFNDSIANFIDAYVTNDETKLTELNKIGLVSDTQLANVKQFNAEMNAAKKESETRKAFIEKLESEKGGMYETFKQTGNIVINNNQNGTSDSGNV